jgi:oligopeptide/dipeptide ABC transporter ATP-binding protein
MHHYTAGLLSASPTPGRHAGTDRLEEIPGLVPVLSTQPDACTFADRCPAADRTCRNAAPPRDTVVTRIGVDTNNHVAACWHPVETARTQPEETKA